jgi:hypothetical protein
MPKCEESRLLAGLRKYRLRITSVPSTSARTEFPHHRSHTVFERNPKSIGFHEALIRSDGRLLTGSAISDPVSNIPVCPSKVCKARAPAVRRRTALTERDPLPLADHTPSQEGPSRPSSSSETRPSDSIGKDCRHGPRACAAAGVQAHEGAGLYSRVRTRQAAATVIHSVKATLIVSLYTDFHSFGKSPNYQLSAVLPCRITVSTAGEANRRPVLTRTRLVGQLASYNLQVAFADDSAVVIPDKCDFGSRSRRETVRPACDGVGKCDGSPRVR